MLRHFRIALKQPPGEDGKIRATRSSDKKKNEKNEQSDRVLRAHRDPFRRLFQRQGLCLVKLQNNRFLEEFSQKNVNKVTGYSEVAPFNKSHESFF